MNPIEVDRINNKKRDTQKTTSLKGKESCADSLANHKIPFRFSLLV